MRTLLLAAALVAALCACGQKAYTRTTVVTPAPVESGPLHAGRHASSAMLAASPADLHCGSQAPVWANERTKVYHLQGDPYYGHTKHGGYMCEQDAVRAGYHASKSK
ncbi:MAG TPA: hypothetical protein VIO32_05935 [Candidatus Baltobacteraceae bacterium]